MSYNIRMTVPVKGAQNPFLIFGTGRSYSCPSGQTIDVMDADARILQNAGWIATLDKDGSVGPTTSRPSAAHIGQMFIDATLGIVIVSDGAGNWLNCITGAVS